MSKHDHRVFDPECEGCRPAMLDMATGEVLKPNHPLMIKARRVWETLTLDEQRAFHRATILNKLDHESQAVLWRFQAALEAPDEPANLVHAAPR